jgi:segregation and condensation protein B
MNNEQTIKTEYSTTQVAGMIEAILFWKGEPVKIAKLMEYLAVDENTVKEGIDKLEQSLTERGIVLIRKDEEVVLGTAKVASALIEKLTKEELVRDLGKAGLETLSVIIYKGPISRAEIDYIRGVQSNFIIRNLSIRGLIERVPNPKDQRSYLYRPTFDLLQYLGLSKIEDMPEFQAVKDDLESFEAQKVDEQKIQDNVEQSLADLNEIEEKEDTEAVMNSPEEKLAPEKTE